VHQLRLGVASGDNLRSLDTRDQYRFPLHLLAYSETINDAGEIDTACASLCGICIDDRSGGKERALESVNRADVGLWPATPSEVERLAEEGVI